MVANVRGNHIASGSTDTWNGKTLKIPPVSPSILDCCIIRVEYSLAVSIHFLCKYGTPVQLLNTVLIWGEKNFLTEQLLHFEFGNNNKYQ